MVVSRAIIRDLYSRDRVGAMISLVIAVMMIAQMLSPLTGGLLETAFGWRAIFYRHRRSVAGDYRRHRDCAAGDAPHARRGQRLPRRCRQLSSKPRLHRLRAVPGAGLADHLHLRRRRPYIVVTQMGRTSAEYGAWFATTAFAYLVGNLLLRPLRAAPFAGEADLVRAGAATDRQPVEPDLEYRRDQPGAVLGCSAPR